MCIRDRYKTEYEESIQYYIKYEITLETVTIRNDLNGNLILNRMTSCNKFYVCQTTKMFKRHHYPKTNI